MYTGTSVAKGGVWGSVAVGGQGVWQGDYSSMSECSVVCTCTYVYAMQCVRFCMCACVSVCM